MLILCSVTTLSITKWWICINKTCFTKILERQDVSRLSISFEPSTTKSKRTKIFVDMIKELFCLVVANWDVACFKSLHVMRTLSIFMHKSLTRRSKCLDCIKLILLHFGGRTSPHNGNTLSSVNTVLTNRMSIEVTDRLDFVRFTLDFNFIRLHGFLNCSANIAQAHINSCLFDTSVGRILDSLQKVVIDWIKSHCKRTINNAAIDLGSKINFHHVTLFQHCLVASIGRVMGSTMVDRTSCWKTNTCF
mmetsp:Transcript_15524/g.23281  ORF Transcript_15524/g.23281 Transcript_15524/m.23281 type:complete len:248 (-) Transcript_15524:422-1165(-)